MIKDGSFSIYNSKGKIIYFGLNDFIEKIANGDCCFICGAEPSDKPFNNEHIIPNWILKKFNLHSKEIRLPNNTFISYSRYKVPCCMDCNIELGEFYEKPISALLNNSYDKIIKTLKENNQLQLLLFKWLCLLYLKTHLKDKYLRWERDDRKDFFPISSIYYWEDMHHIHCIARSHFTNAIIDSKVYGTIIILPSKCFENYDNFDYGDSLFGKGVLLQLGAFSIIAILNDSCAGLSLYNDQIKKISGPLNPFQLREIFSNLNYININLKTRPSFQSNFLDNGEYIISVDLPEFAELVDEEQELVSVGQLLKHYVEPMIKNENKELILKEIEEGRRAYLFDENGNFLDNDNNE
jgi:hypothetical protein